jgi:hypothetical protein
MLQVLYLDVKLDRLSEISPKIFFLERSSDPNDCMAPILLGIFPLKQFDDKFKFVRATKEVISEGISPVKELPDKSKLTKKTNPCHI